jgi:hypothetical protein
VPADGTGAAKLKEAETSVRLCFMGSSRTSLISLSMHTHMGAITPSAIRVRKESGLLWKLFLPPVARPTARGGFLLQTLGLCRFDRGDGIGMPARDVERQHPLQERRRAADATVFEPPRVNVVNSDGTRRPALPRLQAQRALLARVLSPGLG